MENDKDLHLSELPQHIINYDKELIDAVANSVSIYNHSTKRSIKKSVSFSDFTLHNLNNEPINSIVTSKSFNVLPYIDVSNNNIGKTLKNNNKNKLNDNSITNTVNNEKNTLNSIRKSISYNNDLSSLVKTTSTDIQYNYSLNKKSPKGLTKSVSYDEGLNKLMEIKGTSILKNANSKKLYEKTVYQRTGTTTLKNFNIDPTTPIFISRKKNSKRVVNNIKPIISINYDKYKIIKNMYEKIL